MLILLILITILKKNECFGRKHSKTKQYQQLAPDAVIEHDVDNNSNDT